MRPFALVLRAGAVVVAVGVRLLAARRRDTGPRRGEGEGGARSPRPSEGGDDRGRRRRRADPRRASSRSPPSGDIVMGSTPNLPPDGGRTFFDSVETDLAGDVVARQPRGHALGRRRLEVRRRAARNCLRLPDAAVLRRAGCSKAGFTMLNLANNHAFDYGPSGAGRDARSARYKQGLAHTGRPGRRGLPAGRRDQSGGRRICPVSMGATADEHPCSAAPRGRRRRRMPTSSSSPCTPEPRAPATRTYGPGTEMFLGENRGNVVAFSHAVVDAGADVVIGQRAPRAAWDGVVSRAPDRVLARQLRRLQGVRARWAAVG